MVHKFISKMTPNDPRHDNFVILLKDMSSYEFDKQFKESSFAKTNGKKSGGAGGAGGGGGGASIGGGGTSGSLTAGTIGGKGGGICGTGSSASGGDGGGGGLPSMSGGLAAIDGKFKEDTQIVTKAIKLTEDTKKMFDEVAKMLKKLT